MSLLRVNDHILERGALNIFGREHQKVNVFFKERDTQASHSSGQDNSSDSQSQMPLYRSLINKIHEAVTDFWLSISVAYWSRCTSMTQDQAKEILAKKVDADTNICEHIIAFKVLKAYWMDRLAFELLSKNYEYFQIDNPTTERPSVQINYKPEEAASVKKINKIFEYLDASKYVKITGQVNKTTV